MEKQNNLLCLYSHGMTA